ncbi:MAG: phosphoribosylanthranilate isomerase [Kiritimatiellia bacterium]
MTEIKICCMRDAREVELALKWGATALGFVVTADNGPGVISLDVARPLMRQVGDRAERWLLTVHTDLHAIAGQIAALEPSHVQLCDAIDLSHYAALKSRFPNVSLLQVVHVTGPDDVRRAVQLEQHVDGLLLDTGAVVDGQRQLGGTGKTHDWSVSRDIVRAVSVPVWLAGGLGPDNVVAAMQMVGPAGVDLCSGVRDHDYRLDGDKLRAYLAAVRGEDGAIALPSNATMADYQRYIHRLEAMHGWLDVDLVRSCFLMGEEVGEVFKAVRKVDGLFIEGHPNQTEESLRQDVAHEIVDVFNYLLAIANRLDIDLQEAFITKNTENQGREWSP